jgi:hypothetical protein
MQPLFIDQQIHGYRSGHQLIVSTRRLPRQDQDLIDRLSDIGGQLRPGETFKPYLSGYPLPSGSDYVVARTWQDLSAPRSGCVRTRSLIVPIAEWLSMVGIRSLLPLLVPVEFDEKPAKLAPADSLPSIRTVSDPRQVELVEALFFEPRQPIVVFDSAEAELVVGRLLAAFWPALKQNFSVSTYALAPRRIEGRPFDLIFAPKGARARFSDWSGRRIDAVSKSERHPWSRLISEKIFKAEDPDLRTIDTLGALRADQRGDEGALRLALMWNDLAAKSRTTPSAVLGMLDILNSRAWPEFDGSRLQDVVQVAARIAVAEPDEAGALRFLSTLSVKVANFDVGMLDDLDLPGLARDLTMRSPHCALSYIRSEIEAGREPVIPIVAGMADGLGDKRFDDEISNFVLQLPPDLTSVMMLRSDGFAREVWERCATDALGWVPATKTAIGAMSSQEKADLLRKIPAWTKSEAQAPVMEAALDAVSGDDLASFAVAIGKQTGFSIAAFDEPIANAARNAESLNALRESILSNFRGEDADRFLLSTLDLTAMDLEWLDSEVEKTRAVGLLRRLLDNASSKALVSILRDQASRDRIFALLMEDVASSAEHVIRVVGLSDLPIDRYLDIGRALPPFLASEERERFVLELLTRALAQADPDDARVASMIEESHDIVSPRQLVHMATPNGVATQRVAANLVFLSTVSERVKHTAAAAIDDLCERLIHRYGENLGEAGYNAWAVLLRASGNISPDLQLRASLPTLPFAMGKRDLPVSALIRAAFPPVYGELLRSTGDEDFKRLPALLSLPLSFFIDWDRAKSARHELVDAYLYSSWPPADLLLTSLDAGIHNKTLRRLSGTLRGRDYIAAIERDSHRLDIVQLGRIQDCLTHFYHQN